MKNPFKLVGLSSKAIAMVRFENVESREQTKKNVSGFKTIKQTWCSKTTSHVYLKISTDNTFVHANFFLRYWSFNIKNFRVKPL